MTASDPLADLFISPTALRAFRQFAGHQDWGLADADIIEIIQAGCAQAAARISHGQRQDGTPVTYVLVRSVEHRGYRYAFRAVIVPPEPHAGPKAWPVVATVLPGGSKGPRRKVQS